MILPPITNIEILNTSVLLGSILYNYFDEDNVKIILNMFKNIKNEKDVKDTIILIHKIFKKQIINYELRMQLSQKFIDSIINIANKYSDKLNKAFYSLAFFITWTYESRPQKVYSNVYEYLGIF